MVDERTKKARQYLRNNISVKNRQNWWDKYINAEIELSNKLNKEPTFNQIKNALSTGAEFNKAIDDPSKTLSKGNIEDIREGNIDKVKKSIEARQNMDKENIHFNQKGELTKSTKDKIDYDPIGEITKGGDVSQEDIEKVNDELHNKPISKGITDKGDVVTSKPKTFEQKDKETNEFGIFQFIFQIFQLPFTILDELFDEAG